jgi:uncharacterized protein YhfF
VHEALASSRSLRSQHTRSPTCGTQPAYDRRTHLSVVVNGPDARVSLDAADRFRGYRPGMGTSGEDDELAGLRPFELGDSAQMHDELAALVADGRKTAGASLVVEYDQDEDPLPVVGDRWLLTDSAGRRLAVVETTEVRVVPMGDVDLQFVQEEGEGFQNVADWRAAHRDYWNRQLDDLREAAGDPQWQLKDDTPVVCERFRVVRRLGQPG